MSARQQEQRSRMIEENIGLVHACAHRFKGKGIEYDDLFQAGCMGLVKATDAFDSERGVRFSTYAVPVILGEMRRLFRDGGTVKVSRSLKELSMKAARQRDQFAKEHGREPTVSELAQALQVSEEAVVEALGAGAPRFAHQRGRQLPAGPAGLFAGGAALRPDFAAADADPAGGAGPQADRAALLPQHDAGENGAGTGHDPGAGLPPGEKDSALAARETHLSDSSESLTRAVY